jgi:protein involved in polysaccharide export with SLBB domain
MKTRLLFIFCMVLLPVMVLRAQTGAPLRVGDVIELRLAGVPADVTEFNAPFTIDDDGNVNLPLLNKVKVAGLLPTEIQDTIEKKLVDGKFFTHPVITVQQGSVPRFINLSGEVRSNGRIPYTADMTLMNAITASGGFSDFADQKKIDLMRDGKTTRYNGVAISRGQADDPKVLPGDKIIVQKSIF